MKTLKFKLYQHKRNRYLKRIINAARMIYNHCIALHKRYYWMWGKHLNCAKLQAHIAKLRNRNSCRKLVDNPTQLGWCRGFVTGSKASAEQSSPSINPGDRNPD